RRHGDFALAGVVCGVQVADGRIERAALAMFGMGSVPERLADVENRLAGTGVDGTGMADLDLDDIGQAGVADLDPPADVHATGSYRKKIGAVLIGRALSAAIREAVRG